MVSSSNEALPPIASNTDLPDGGELVHKYLNDEAVSANHPSSSPMLSSRGMTPNSDGKPKNSSNTSQTGNPGGDSRGASEGPGRHRASRAGARSVSKLTPAQLARKRANDREAQRAIRQRTKEHIDNLEREIHELKTQRQQAPWEIEQRNRELEETVAILKQQLAELKMQRDAALAGQPLPLGMGAEGQDMSSMDWPPMSMPYDANAMTPFDPQSIGVSRPGELAGPGSDLVRAYANQNPDIMTPYPSESPTAGNFPDMAASALNYGQLPGQDDLIGLSGDLATPTWTNSVNPPFQMGDPNMFSPPNRYLNSEDVPYPYNTQPPPSLPEQPQRAQQQLEPSSMQFAPPGPGMNTKYELSPTPMPNPPQQVRTPQSMRQAQSSLPTPPEQKMQQRPQQQQRSQQQAMQKSQRPLQPNLQPKPQKNQSQQQQRQTPLPAQVGGIPIAPAPPPPAHLQRSQASSQNLPPIQQEQQFQQQGQFQQRQQQQQQILQRRSSLQPSQQLQGNMLLQSPPLQPRQPSIPYWAQTPTFIPPINLIDNLLHSALAQHRLSVRNGGTNQRAPDYSSLVSFNSPSAPNPLLTTGGDPAPLSSAISRAIQVAGFKGIATQAAVLYTTHCLLRWQADPQPETYAHIPNWLRPGKMQLQVPHALWVSQLVWRGLREWVAGNGGRYVRDEFVLCYARNLELEWQEGQGRSLTGGATIGPGFDDRIFEMNSNGKVVTTSKFEATIRDQSSWGLRREFFVEYPELGELVRRARD